MRLLDGIRSLLAGSNPGHRETAFRGDPSSWRGCLQRVDGVPFDFAFLIQRQFVIFPKYVCSLTRHPKLKGAPVYQPIVPRLLNQEHDYFRLAMTRDVVGREEELLRYYRLVWKGSTG